MSSEPDIPKLKKPEWPAFIAEQFGLPPVMGIGGPWQSSEGTTNVAWFRAMCELFGIEYPGSRVLAMRALVEAVGQKWDEASMSSTQTKSKGGGNVRKEAYEALWTGLLDGESLPGDALAPEDYSDGWHRDEEDALPDTTTVVRNIRLRHGQAAFRNRLLAAYEEACAITSCDVLEALEAAHVLSHSAGGTMATNNGILMRADIHTLFDLGLISIDTTTWTVVVSESLHSTEFGSALQGQPVRLPSDPSDYPDTTALDQHRHACGL